MTPRYKLELNYVTDRGVPYFSIWKREPGAFWGETWTCVSPIPMPLDYAKLALGVLNEFEREKGTT